MSTCQSSVHRLSITASVFDPRVYMYASSHVIPCIWRSVRIFISETDDTNDDDDDDHWRRLVENIGEASQNILREKLVKTDKCMCVSQL